MTARDRHMSVAEVCAELGHLPLDLLRLARQGPRAALLQAAQRRPPHPAQRLRNLARIAGGGGLMATTYDVRIWKVEPYQGKTMHDIQGSFGSSPGDAGRRRTRHSRWPRVSARI